MRRPDPTRITLSIYDYLDFRKYLSDLTAEFKKKRPGFTVRTFATQAGLKSPGLLKMVIDGDRRLTDDTRDAFCQAFEIGGKEKIYFDMLVRYNQTRDPDEKRVFFETLNDLRPRSHRFTLEKSLHRYLTRDYYVTIREMVLLDDFREDDDWIASRCAPPITASEAHEAVETLLELGFLQRDEQGKLAQAQVVLKAGERNTQALEAYHFHQAVLNKARYMLGYLEQDQRSYQSLTLTVPKGMTEEVITEYLKFQDWVVARSNELGGNDEVFQVNFQLFPVTQKTKSDAS